MPTYRLTISRYTAMRDGQRIGPWQRGQEIDLSEAEAAWVNADSSGALDRVLPPEPEPEPTPDPVDVAPPTPVVAAPAKATPAPAKKAAAPAAPVDF